MASFLRQTFFGGLRPAVSPFHLPATNAQVAHNVLLGDGRLCPIPSPVLARPGPVGSVWTVPDYADHASVGLVTFPDPEVYVAPLYTACNPGLKDVGVFRKGTVPRRMSVSGTFSRLVPTAPTVALTASDVTPSSVTPPSEYTGPDARAYTYTWVYEHGVESRPAPPVVVGNTFDGASWQLSLPPAPADALGVRIYRMTYGTDEIGSSPKDQQLTSFHLVTELDPSVSVWVDNVRQSDMDFGELLTQDQCDPPDMEQVFALENGCLVGWSGNRVFFSEHGEPWNWPVKYRFEVEHEIVGMAVAGNSAFVGTTGRPYRLDVKGPAGDAAELAVAVHAYDEIAPLHSRHAIAPFPWGAVMAADFNLVQLTSNSLIPLIRYLVLDEQWRSKWRPDHMAYHDGRLYAAGAEVGGWSLDIKHDGDVRADALVTVDLDATRLHYGLDGELYFIDGSGDVRRWGGGPPMPYRWVSPKYRMRGRTKFAAAKIDGDFTAGPTTLVVTSDGAAYDTHVASSPETWRLPQGPRGVTWELRLEGVACIDEVHVAQSRYELIQVPQETSRA